MAGVGTRGQGHLCPKCVHGSSEGLRASSPTFFSAGDGDQQSPTLSLLPFPSRLSIAVSPSHPLPARTSCSLSLPLSALTFAFPVWAEEVWPCAAAVVVVS